MAPGRVGQHHPGCPDDKASAAQRRHRAGLDTHFARMPPHACRNCSGSVAHAPRHSRRPCSSKTQIVIVFSDTSSPKWCGIETYEGANHRATAPGPRHRRLACASDRQLPEVTPTDGGSRGATTDVPESLSLIARISRLGLNGRRRREHYALIKDTRQVLASSGGRSDDWVAKKSNFVATAPQTDGKSHSLARNAAGERSRDKPFLICRWLFAR
jgi:hypothetical protein